MGKCMTDRAAMLVLVWMASSVARTGGTTCCIMNPCTWVSNRLPVT